jgi:hypothetical protein
LPKPLKHKSLTDEGRKQRSETVRRLRREKAERRTRLATDFRAQLLLQVAPAVTSASTQALVDACVSAYVEMTELSASFLNGRASPKDRERLGLTRGQLQRCLRSLRLIDAAEDETPDNVANDLKRIEARVRQPEGVGA